MRLRWEVLEEHRRAVGERLGLHRHDGDLSGREPLVWQARLATAHRVGTADLLVLMPDGGYVPVLIRGHRTTDPGVGAVLTGVDDLAGWAVSWTPGGRLPREQPAKKLRPHAADVSALAHFYRMLEDLGLASRETRGGIIGFGGPAHDPSWNDGAVIAWHRLETDSGGLAEYDAQFADRVAVATAAATRQPALAQPSRVGECRRCPWWSVCGPQLVAAHDVSLLVSGADVEAVREAGIRRLDDVAALSVEECAALPLTGVPDARVRARAMVREVPLVRRPGDADVTRADVELDVDMESYGDDGAYLWGTYLTGAELDGFPAGYRPFATWQPLDSEATARNFVEFWEYLRALRHRCADQGLTFAAYCYSHRAEERWLYGTVDRFAAFPGMPSRDEIAEFCGSDEWVDLYVELRRIFVIPGSMRLKALAPLAGFSWRDPDPGGANSMAWYRLAASDAAEAEANRERILRYNEDDVLATLRLRQWVADGAGGAPTIAELDALWE